MHRKDTKSHFRRISLEKKSSNSKYVLIFILMTGSGVFINWIPFFAGLIIPFDSLKSAGLAILALPILFIAVPVIYYKISSDFSIKYLGRSLYQKFRDDIFDKLAEAIIEKQKKRAEKKDSSIMSLSIQDFDEYLKKVPKVLRHFIKKVAKRVSFFDRAEAAVSEIEPSDSFPQVIKNTLKTMGDKYIFDGMLSLPWLKTGLVFGINIALILFLIII